MDTEELLRHRMLKFRSLGGFQEGVPVDPKRKRKMKPSELNTLKAADVESDLENIKQSILKAKVPSDPITTQGIEKLKKDVDKEITNAFISMGLQEKVEQVKLAISKAPSNKPLDHNIKQKVDKIMEEVNRNLSQPGAYLSLKQKLERLNTVNRLIDLKAKSNKLKSELNEKLPAEVKEKLKLLKNAQEMLAKGDPLDENLVDEVTKAKQQLIEVLKSANLEIIGVTNRKIANSSPPHELQEKIISANKDIHQEIDRLINSNGLSSKIEELKAEIANGSNPEKVEKMQGEIKEEIVAALNAESLKDKLENVHGELASFVDTVTQEDDKVPAENGRW